MNFFEILKLLFTRYGDKEIITRCITSLSKIPKFLKIILGLVIFIGLLYYGYQKVYNYELSVLQEEVNELHNMVNMSVNHDEYTDDVGQLLDAIQVCMDYIDYNYESEQMRLKLLEIYVTRYHPQDPITYDINQML